MGHAGVPMIYDPHRKEFWDALDSCIESEQLQTMHGIALNELESNPFWRVLRERNLLLFSQILRACRLSYEKGNKRAYRDIAGMR